MRRFSIAWILLVLFALPLAADSIKATASNDQIKAYAMVLSADGTIDVTLTWGQAHRDGLVVVFYSVGSTDLQFASWSNEAGIARVCGGAPAGTVCGVAYGLPTAKGRVVGRLITRDNGQGPRLTRKTASTSRPVDLAVAGLREIREQ